jgi:hypothetical protein
MKVVDHKQEFSQFCHSSGFNVSLTGDFIYVKTIISLIQNTRQQMHVMTFVAFPTTEYDEVLSGYQPGQMTVARTWKMIKKTLIFFDNKGTVNFEFIPQGQTVSQAYYLETTKRLREAVRRKRPELWPND